MATNHHHNYSDPSAHNAPRQTHGDLRICADCGQQYNARTGECRTCPTRFWAIWDAVIYDDPAAMAEPDAAERGIYARGFTSKAQAVAAIAAIQASMAEAGHDIPTWQFVVVRED